MQMHKHYESGVVVIMKSHIMVIKKLASRNVLAGLIVSRANTFDWVCVRSCTILFHMSKRSNIHNHILL